MTTEQIWQIVYQIAVIVVALLAGGAAVDVIKWLKKKLRTSGEMTLVLVGVVAVVLTLAAMIVEAVIVPGAVTVENFGMVVVAIFAASQARYRMLVDELEEEIEGEIEIEEGLSVEDKEVEAGAVIRAPSTLTCRAIQMRR